MVTSGLHTGPNRYGLSAGQITPVHPEGKVRSGKVMIMLRCVICRVWSIQSCEMVNTLIHHCEAVLHLRFSDGIMVTCSKVWPL